MEIRREMRPELEPPQGGRRAITKGLGWLGGNCVAGTCAGTSP